MRIKVITYNVKNSNQAINDLYSLCEPSYDLILISIQEYYLFMFKFLQFKNYAHKQIENIWGLVTIVLSKDKISIKWNKKCFGLLYCGNKGYITCTINKSIIFVSAHLSHGQDNYKRVIELKEITEKIDKKQNNKSIPLIIAGDLNFRMTKCDLEKSYDENKKYDQLVTLKRELGLFEYRIDFLPTFKLNINSSANLPTIQKYNLSRTPSYCDRILFRGINVNFYKNVDSFIHSDHKPVVMECTVKFRQNVINSSSVCHFSLLSCAIFNYSVLFLIIFGLLTFKFFF